MNERKKIERKRDEGRTTSTKTSTFPPFHFLTNSVAS